MNKNLPNRTYERQRISIAIRFCFISYYCFRDAFTLLVFICFWLCLKFAAFLLFDFIGSITSASATRLASALLFYRWILYLLSFVWVRIEYSLPLFSILLWTSSEIIPSGFDSLKSFLCNRSINVPNFLTKTRTLWLKV